MTDPPDSIVIDVTAIMAALQHERLRAEQAEKERDEARAEVERLQKKLLCALGSPRSARRPSHLIAGERIVSAPGSPVTVTEIELTPYAREGLSLRKKKSEKGPKT